MACRFCTAWIGKIVSSGTVSRLWTVPLLLIFMTLYTKRFLRGNQPRLSCPSTQSTVTVEPVVMLPSSSFLLSMVSTVCCT